MESVFLCVESYVRIIRRGLHNLSVSILEICDINWCHTLFLNVFHSVMNIITSRTVFYCYNFESNFSQPEIYRSY
jgi:hypothetical protein